MSLKRKPNGPSHNAMSVKESSGTASLLNTTALKKGREAGFHPKNQTSEKSTLNKSFVRTIISGVVSPGPLGSPRRLRVDEDGQAVRGAIACLGHKQHKTNRASRNMITF